MTDTPAFPNRYTAYIPGIDGLRALAVLSVVLFHFNSALLPGGFSGVDVFFVISGYVVSASLAKEGHAGFRAFLAGFYARRIRRIYPALVVCLLTVGVLQALFVPSSWLSTTSNKTGMLAFFGLSNFALVWFNDGYFSPRVEFNAFTHTWSLGVEEQFYLLFPIIFFIWLRSRRRGLTRFLLAGLLAASLLVSWYQGRAMTDHAYYLLPSRFWELAAGALLFKCQASGGLTARTVIAGDACILSGLLLIGLGFAFSDPKAFPIPWAILPVAGTVLAIAGVTGETRRQAPINRLLDNALSVYVGKISYSLYLWHWPAIVLFRWTIGLETWAAVLSAVLLTVLASIVSYHWIELPMRRAKFASSLTDWGIVARGAIAVGISAFLAAGIYKAQPYLSLSATKDKANWYPEAWPSASAEKRPVPTQFRDRHLFVLGDSHARAYETLLQILRDEQGLSVKKHAEGGCSVAGLLREADPACAGFIEQAVSRIKAEAKPGDIVLLASLRLNRLGDQWSTFSDLEIESRQFGPASLARRKAALDEAEALISDFEASGLTVVMEAPKPLFKSPPFRCADWFNARNPVCEGGMAIDRAFLLRYRQPVMESIAQLASRHTGMVVWDPFPVLCPSETCTAFDNGLPIFFDGDHLSGHGNRMLYPSLVSVLNAVWRPAQ